jgi:hypothetical protein
MDEGHQTLEPASKDEHVLLRVAPDDAVVPIELLRACAADGAVLDAAPLRVIDLRRPRSACSSID